MRTLDELHPLTITLYFLAAAGLTMFCSHPALLVLSLVGAVVFCFAGGGAGRWQSHAASLVLLAVLTLVNPLTSHNGATVLVVINDLPVTLETLLAHSTAVALATPCCLDHAPTVPCFRCVVPSAFDYRQPPKALARKINQHRPPPV